MEKNMKHSPSTITERMLRLKTFFDLVREQCKDCIRVSCLWGAYPCINKLTAQEAKSARRRTNAAHLGPQYKI